MPLSLSLRNDVWTVSSAGKPVAEIHMDLWHQVDCVILYSEAPQETLMDVLHLAASHVQQFVANRTVSGGLMVAEYRDSKLTVYDSMRIMDEAQIPEKVRAYDRERIVDEFRSLNIPVIDAVHRSWRDALAAVLKQVGVRMRWSVAQRRSYLPEIVRLKFHVRRPHRFICWKDESYPTDAYEQLHVVPSYHPVMQNWREVDMVNGATDACIGGYAVRSIFSPRASRAKIEKSYGSSWDHMQHPYIGAGQWIQFEIDRNKLRSQKGVDHFASVLRACLSIDRTYIAINGGFRAPLKYPSNRLHELGIVSPMPQRGSRRSTEVRGSEDHCVWAYRTLEAEGKLDDAYVPPWLIQEGWLGIYKDAEVRPGIF